MTVNDRIKGMIDVWIGELQSRKAQHLAVIDTLDSDQVKAEFVKLSAVELDILKLQELLLLLPKETEGDTFADYVRRLNEDESFRLQESRYAEVLRLSMEKCRERLYQPHQFCDMECDPIVLNHESIFLQ